VVVAIYFYVYKCSCGLQGGPTPTSMTLQGRKLVVVDIRRTVKLN
jgi:hypothetical protein